MEQITLSGYCLPPRMKEPACPPFSLHRSERGGAPPPGQRRHGSAGTSRRDGGTEPALEARIVMTRSGNRRAALGFHATDIYSEVGLRLKGAIPKGFIAYGEIIGWAGDAPIQSGFTYRIPACFHLRQGRHCRLKLRYFTGVPVTGAVAPTE
jgi:hypothetical protein